MFSCDTLFGLDYDPYRDKFAFVIYIPSTLTSLIPLTNHL